MKKLLYILAFSFILASSMSTPNVAFATTCPFTANDNTYVVNFPAKTLFSNQGASNSYVATAANIPAGTYNITLHAYDDHSVHGGQNQQNERYFIIATKHNGTTFTSNPSADIAETSDTATTLVNSNVEFTSQINNIKAVHFGYPGTGNYQSIDPICVKFTKVNTTPDPALVVTCTVSKTNPALNESITYTANVTGGDNPYTYAWSGSLGGTTKEKTKAYATPGTHDAAVKVTDSDGRTQTAQCPVVTVATNHPTLDGTCTISPSTALINQEVTFRAIPTGGNGTYTYSWSGSDGITNTAQTFTGRYATAGSKYANVTITSNGQSITRSCNVTVQTDTVINNNLDGSCYANPTNATINQNVNWYATATGGTGNYTYSWSGTDNLTGYGSQINRSYQYGGYKSGTITITSGSQTITRSCSVNVQDNVIINQNLAVYCTASPSNATVGQNVIWTAYATGGSSYGYNYNGNYTYSWSGTDGLSYGNASSVQRSYSTTGTKSAYVTVYGQNGQSVSATCSMNVTGGSNGGVTVIRDSVQTGTPISGVFLSQLPATGISGSLKVTLFALGILLWSLAIGYFLSKRKAVATTAGSMSTSDKIAEFKRNNLLKKNK